MPPEKLFQLRIVQIDIIVCWILYILEIIAISVLPTLLLLFVTRNVTKYKRKRGIRK